MQQVLFEERFLDQYTGKKLLRDPVTAIVELVANSWDAGATRVDITWPSETDNTLIIKDNGEGMAKDEFVRRWLTLSYNRLSEQSDSVQIVGQPSLPLRKTFGRNGIGRFAGFCFANEYSVHTAKNGRLVKFTVRKGASASPIELIELDDVETTETGTSIDILTENNRLTADRIKSEIGMRFLTDPNFEVYVNRSKISFTDLPGDGFKEYNLTIEENGGSIRIVMIDAKKTDRTTKQHGIAWQVNGRLVGNCSWQGSGHETLIDGRRIEAKRYTFIIFADILDDPEIIKPDWTGFYEDNERFLVVQKAVRDKINEVLLGLTVERRCETSIRIQQANDGVLRKMSPISREKWIVFVDKAQEVCPSIAEKDLEALSGLIATLELSGTRYSLIHQLHDLNPSQLDDLNRILNEWTVDTAKIVLDELQWRLKLISELQNKISSSATLEVQDLQPIFEKGLWIFGPEFETIEYTSNEGMTTVIKKLCKSDVSGSLNRPDFAILTDGSVGLYSYPEYDDEYSEIGTASLAIVELKKPGITIGSEQKGQCWKYVKELYSKGFLSDKTKVRCFVLGSTIDPEETDKRTEKDGRVVIQPMLFNTVLERSKSRVLKLYDKIKNAPFLQGEHLDEFLDYDVNAPEESDLLDSLEESVDVISE